MQQVRIDFDNPGLPQSLGVVEGESQSRIFQAALYKSGAAYTAPAGAVYSIMYRGFGPQNQGWYDTIEDGAGKRAACTVSGNVVTCELARQALRVPGHLTVVLCVSDSKGYMLKSWPIMADVRNDGYEDTVEVESFFYIAQITSAEWEKAFAAWEDFKAMIDPTLSLSGKAADAKETGDKVGELKEDIVDQFIETEGLVSLYKNPIFWRSGGFINDTNGGVGTSTDDYKYSGYINIHNNDYVYVNLYFPTTCGIAFYNADKKYISGVHNTINTEPYRFNKLVQIPANAKFMRVTTRKITDSTFYSFVDYEDLLKAYKNWKNLSFRTNKYLDFSINSTGQFVKADGTFRTDLFNIAPTTKYETNFSGRIAFYDKEKAFVSAQVLSAENSFVSPDNATYCALGGARAINDYENIYVNAVEDITIGGINRLATVGHFETELQSYIAYKSDWKGDNGSRFYLVPKQKVTNGVGGCLKIFGDNYPKQGDYRDLGIYFSANQNGDDGFYHNGVNWINVKVYDTGEYANKHPDLGFSFQDGAVIAGKVFCFDGKKPYWLFGTKTPTMNMIACAEFASNIGISANGGGIILKSPNGTIYKISVDDNGNLKTRVVN